MDLTALDPKVILIILSINAALSAITYILSLFTKPDTTAGKVAGWINAVVKFISANVKSK